MAGRTSRHGLRRPGPCRRTRRSPLAGRRHARAVDRRVEVAARAPAGGPDGDGPLPTARRRVVRRRVVRRRPVRSAPAGPARRSPAGSPPRRSSASRGGPSRSLMPRRNRMAASETVSGRPGRPLRGARPSTSRSSQTRGEPHPRSAALRSHQLVARSRAGGGLPMPAHTSGPTLHARPPRGRRATRPMRATSRTHRGPAKGQLPPPCDGAKTAGGHPFDRASRHAIRGAMARRRGARRPRRRPAEQSRRRRARTDATALPRHSRDPAPKCLPIVPARGRRPPAHDGLDARRPGRTSFPSLRASIAPRAVARSPCRLGHAHAGRRDHADRPPTPIVAGAPGA